MSDEPELEGGWLYPLYEAIDDGRNTSKTPTETQLDSTPGGLPTRIGENDEERRVMERDRR